MEDYLVYVGGQPHSYFDEGKSEKAVVIRSAVKAINTLGGPTEGRFQKF